MFEKGEILIFTAINDMDVGQDMVTDLLEQGLIMSGTIFPEVKLLYKWDGQITMDDEIKILLKAKEENYEGIEEYLRGNHPYMFPEVVRIEATFGSKRFKDFLKQKNA